MIESMKKTRVNKGNLPVVLEMGELHQQEKEPWLYWTTCIEPQHHQVAA